MTEPRPYAQDTGEAALNRAVSAYRRVRQAEARLDAEREELAAAIRELPDEDTTAYYQLTQDDAAAEEEDEDDHAEPQPA